MRGHWQALRPVENPMGAVFYAPLGVLGCELLGSAGVRAPAGMCAWKAKASSDPVWGGRSGSRTFRTLRDSLF